MSESFFEEISRYVRFSDDDRRALSELHDAAKPHFASIAERFYERLYEHDEAAAVLQNPEQVERLRVSLVAWLDGLLSGPWDEGYFARRSRIGRMHIKVKLPQRYMFTAMSLVRTQLFAIARNSSGDDRESCAATIDAVSRIIDLELAIMLETYSEAYVDGMRRFERIERDLLEQRLAQSEERYMAVVESANILVLAVDRANTVLVFNRRAEQVSEYSRSEILGKNWIDVLCHRREREALVRATKTVASGQLVDPIEAQLMTRTGDIKWIRWHLNTLGGSDGSVVGAIGLDVSEEHALAARTRRAESLASLGTLAAGLAHEIRNPLNAAQLQLRLVERRLARIDDDNAEKAQIATKIVQSELRRLGGLVEDFLAFARPHELRIASGDLRETVRTVATLLAPDVELQGVTLDLKLDEPVAARFDEERMKQVLLNLVRNSIEAAGSGGEITVSLRRLGQMAEILIADTGPGIEAGMNVFEPFTTTKVAGTGLGLPIVHRIISDHGGSIDYRRVGSRTIFAVEIPVDGPSQPNRSTR